MGGNLILRSRKTVGGGATETSRDEGIPAFEKGALAGTSDAGR
jgi:hypothetical protein